MLTTVILSVLTVLFIIPIETLNLQGNNYVEQTKMSE